MEVLAVLCMCVAAVGVVYYEDYKKNENYIHICI